MADGVPIHISVVFPDIEMIMLTPLVQVCNTVVIVENRMFIYEKSKNSSVIRVFEVSGGEGGAGAVIVLQHVESCAYPNRLHLSLRKLCSR